MREHHVEVAVAVNVGKGRTAPDDGFEQVRTGLFRRNGDKASAILVAGVPKQLGRLRVGLARLDFADFLLQMPVGREQVQPAVQIVIEEEQTKLEKPPAVRADASVMASSEKFVGEFCWT